MKRREFIAGIGSAVAWPLTARAQPRTIPVLGFLNLGSPNETRWSGVGGLRAPPMAASAGAGGLEGSYVVAFRKGLAEAGFVAVERVGFGRPAAPNRPRVLIDYRGADYQELLLAPLAAELVQHQVAVILALDSGPAALAAKAATSTIPIVFALGADPIKLGLVASLSRPGGNITGVTLLSAELTGKRLDLLREIAPRARTVAYMTAPEAPDSEAATREMLATAGELGLQAPILEARNARDIGAAFATLVERRADALVVGPHVLFERNSKEIVELAARHKIPAIYSGPRFVALGGLMSYSSDLLAAVREVGSLYVAQILRGATPADLPVQQPTKFELVVNLKTARALGLTIPQSILARADEVIE